MVLCCDVLSRATKESSWNRPPAGTIIWKEVTDQASGKTYFVNRYCTFHRTPFRFTSHCTLLKDPLPLLPDNECTWSVIAVAVVAVSSETRESVWTLPDGT
jgi:hypothetical protein